MVTAKKIPQFPIPTDVVIDLETLGNRWDAVVVAIGAAAFDRNGGKVGQTYYAEIKVDDALKYGRVTGSTLEWWMKQDLKARRVFTDHERKVTTYEALRGLFDFMRSISSALCAWGNGSSFDITLIERLVDTAGNGLKEHWQYGQVRDQRTIVDAADIQPWDKKMFPREGVHHNALDDAIFQAGVIQYAYRKINAGLDLLEKAGGLPAPKAAPAPSPATTVADDDEEL